MNSRCRHHASGADDFFRGASHRKKPDEQALSFGAEMIGSRS